METIANLSKLNELQAELASLIKAKSQCPRLTLEDHEDVSDNYQMHLEIQYEIDGIEEEIAALQRNLGD